MKNPGMVTSRFLVKLKACEDQLDLFKKVFPRGAELSEADVVKAAKAGLSLGWLAEHTLSGPALAEYDKARGPALAEYKKARGRAWAKYEKACGPARAKYEKVRGPARAEFEKACGPALAEYDRTCGCAWLKLYRP